MTDRFETLIDTLDRRSESVLNQLKQATKHIKKLEQENMDLRRQLEQVGSERDALIEANRKASVAHSDDDKSTVAHSDSQSPASESDVSPASGQSAASFAETGVPIEPEAMASVDDSSNHEIIEEQTHKVSSSVHSEIVRESESESGRATNDSTLPSPQALLKQWYERYPSAFFKAHTYPLKVGIHKDLIAREPWPSKLIRRALANYVNLPRYLKSVRVGAIRVDLDGQPAGDIGEEDVQHAREQLELLQKRRREREERNAAERMSKKIAQLNERLGH